MRVAAFAITIALVCSGVAAAPRKHPSSATVPHAYITGPADFLRTIAAIRSYSESSDKFKEPVQSPLLGQPFKVALPVNSELTSAGVSYDYQNGKLVLGFEPRHASPLRAQSDSLAVLAVAENLKDLGSYIGQNAFGATAKVNTLEHNGAGIAIVSGPKSMLRGASTFMGRAIGGSSGWWFEQELAPADAKALASASSLIVEGTYTKLPWGDVGFCDFYGSEATLENPTEYYSQTCYLGAIVTRIAFIDNRTGATLKEWTSTANPVLGPELWGGIRVGMDKYQLKALWPSITDYGHLDTQMGPVEVQMDNQQVASVQLYIRGDGDSIYKALVGRYGRPVAGKCVIRGMCEAKWLVNDKVAAFLDLSGKVTYQTSDAPAPVGFPD